MFIDVWCVELKHFFYFDGNLKYVETFKATFFQPKFRRHPVCEPERLFSFSSSSKKNHNSAKSLLSKQNALFGEVPEEVLEIPDELRSGTTCCWLNLLSLLIVEFWNANDQSNLRFGIASSEKKRCSMRFLRVWRGWSWCCWEVLTAFQMISAERMITWKGRERKK